MRIGILGASGNSGRALVRSALTRGHDVTAFVRHPEKIADLAHGRLTIGNIRLEDHDALVEALSGHDVVINAAGHIADGATFTALVAGIIHATDVALGRGGRFWLFGGAALLDVPAAGICTLDLPGVPRIYGAHRTNHNAVRATGLDWSMLCPGPMIPSPDGEATRDLAVSTEGWPVPRPGYSRLLPSIALSVAFRQALPRMTIYYEDAAQVILDNLGTAGPYSRKRVGVALPKGETRRKQPGTR